MKRLLFLNRIIVILISVQSVYSQVECGYKHDKLTEYERHIRFIQRQNLLSKDDSLSDFQNISHSSNVRVEANSIYELSQSLLPIKIWLHQNSL